MTHAHHRVHENSREAYYSELQNLSDRKRAVYDWIKQHGPCTDRDVMRGLGFVEPNATRPRISELVEAGLIEEIHIKALCPVTGKHVRLVRIKPSQQEMFA